MLATGESLRKARKGVIRVKVSVDPRTGRIVEANITGDFFIYPEDTVWILEDSLKGSPVGEAKNVVLKVLENVELKGSTTDDFVEAVLEALSRAGVACETLLP
ncbi:MAG: hypothetical protein NZ954_07920 [Thermofilaceae archaeon]|nr:hypothetical protein [Thermofilaceae archaeon]MCX8179928.1 hypothetical protein [Thermofilaceae archaeon]MDW8004381.1 lipoate protein ligase C-terminal domain-containing protein [Thermofilaceae archaeon]